MRRRFTSLGVFLIAVAFLCYPLTAEDSGILKQISDALERRSRLLRNFSAEITTRRELEGPFGAQGKETVEKIYQGEKGQFAKESLHVSGADFRGPEGGRGSMRLMGAAPDVFYTSDWLTAEAFLSGAEVLGKETIEGKECYKIRTRPTISGLQVSEALLWADSENGMPVRIRVKFSFGRFEEAELLQNLQLVEEKNITLPAVQRVTLRGGAGGFGMSLQLRTTWKHYEWDLQLSPDVFKRQAASDRQALLGSRGAQDVEAALRAAQGRSQTGRSNLPNEEDPFEQLDLLPNTAEAGQPASPGRSSLDSNNPLVVIQGAESPESGRGRNEGSALGRIFPGFRDGAGEGNGVFGQGGPQSFGGRGGFGEGFGGGAGGGRGRFIAGSRANRLQGSLQSSFSGSVLDARPFSLTGEEAKKGDYSTWNGGLSFGLPLSNTNSARKARRTGSFLFLSFEGQRGEELQSTFASVPSLLERQGNFSQTTYRSGPLAGSSVRIFDPASAKPYSGGIIPESRLNPIAVNVLQYFPSANRNDPHLNYFSQQSLGNHRDRLNLRLTYPLTEGVQLAGAYNLNRSAADTFNAFPTLAGRRNGLGQNLSITANDRRDTGVLHNIQVSLNRNRSRTANPFAFKENASANLGIRNTSQAPIDFGLPTFQFTNYTTLRDGNSSFNVREELTASDHWMLTWRKHFFRIGGEYSSRRRNPLGSPDGAGTLVFAGTGTSQYVGGSTPRPGTGYDFADFLLGRVQSSSIQYGNSDHYYRGYRFSLYVDDNYRVHSRFTLQWGIRYSFSSPWTEKYNRLANLDVQQGFTRVQSILPGGTGSFSGLFPRALIQTDRNNLAPRTGFALRLNPKTVLRGSYGVFHPDEVYEQIVNELGAQPPFAYTVQQVANLETSIDLFDPFATEFVSGIPNTYAVDLHFQLETVQNWNLSLQHSLGRTLFFSVGYAGSKGTGLELLRAPNRYENGKLRIPDAAQFLYLSSGASSTFHGLQVLALRRMRSGLSISGQYEFGKSIDNAASIAGGPRTVAQNDEDLRSERALSRFDVRHRASIRGMWELPFGSRQRWFRDSGIFNSLLSNWFLNGNLSATSGRPFTARVLGNQINNSRSGSFSSERAAVTGQSPQLPDPERTANRFFNTEAFRLPDPGTFGNAGRNTIIGPGSWSVNLSLYRIFALSDELRLMLSAEARNILNHVNHASIDTVVNSRGFGRVTSTGPMRTIQLNFRLLF